MPSEQSFADRIGRFARLKEACAEMSPAFAPADADITVSAQGALLDRLNECCEEVSSAEIDWKDLTGPRVTLVKTIRERVTRALNRVQSCSAWESKLPAVKAAADKVRNMSPPKTPDPDAPAPKKRDRGGQSYKDVEGHFEKFTAALAKCPDYDTGAPPDIAGSALALLLEQLQTANSAIPEKEVALSDAQAERQRVFASKQPLPDGSHSLRNRWKRIKQAVSAQYGRSSKEFGLVQRINY